MSGVGWERYLLRYAASYRRSLAVGCGLAVGQALVVIALPWPVKLAVDNVLKGQPTPRWAGWLDDVPGAATDAGRLVVLGVASVLLVLLGRVLAVAWRVSRQTLGMRMTNDLAYDTLERVQRRSPASSRVFRSGDLVQRVVSDTKCIDTLVIGFWMTAFQSLVTFALLAVVIVSVSSLIVFIAVGVAVPMLIIARVYRDRMRRDAIALADAQADVPTATEQMLSTLPEVQSFGAEPAELARFSHDADRRVAAAVRSQRTSVEFRIGIGFVTALGTAMIMVVGGWLVLDGATTLGTLLVLLSYAASLFGYVEGLAFLAPARARARGGALRILALVGEDDEVPEPEHPVEPPSVGRGARITFEGVSFGYAPKSLQTTLCAETREERGKARIPQRAQREPQTLVIERSRTRVVRATTAAGAALVLSLIGWRGLVAPDSLSSEDGKLFMLGVASLAMLLPAFAVLLSVPAQKASPAARSASDDASGATPSAPPAIDTPTTVTAPSGAVTSSAATRPERPVLQDVNLDIAPGETVAVVGPTGAGKSSLVSLVPRFFDPWSGSVKVDGVDVRRFRIRDLRRRVAVVRQDPLLLPVSVRENIAYGSPWASESQVRAAAEQALAADFIEALPEGYDTVLGERGATLSGGQRQRLAIARAICRDAPILILDEPTAALDAESETSLLELITRAAAGRTIVMIAHRLSTVRWADRIVVVQGGRIVEEGDHEALLALGGVYARYLQIQAGGHDLEPVESKSGG
jgi:ABC-type multidrug transport system fused ATPase/permease subunit